jgi:DNA-binding transcriptional ArsR family regulator
MLFHPHTHRIRKRGKTIENIGQAMNSVNLKIPAASFEKSRPKGHVLNSRLTCNQMVAYLRRMVANEDKVFKALADASRRQLLDRLRQKGGLTLGEMCQGHDMSRQAVTKHLVLLEAANLVVSVKRGREKLHYLNPVPIQEIYTRWIGKFERKQVQALFNLKQALENKE